MSVWSETIKGQFDFLVDTGSDITALTTGSLKRFRYQPRNVGPAVRKTGGIAQRGPTYKFASPVTLKALDEAGRVCTFPDFQLYAMETDEEIPCILGRDFLVSYDLSVQFDPRRRTIVLEGREPVGAGNGLPSGEVQPK